MNVDNFRQMYVAELQEMRSVEAQLIDALPRMAELASHPELKQAIRSHFDETQTHMARLDEILRRHGAEPREHVDQAMQAMIREAEKWANMIRAPDLRDAELIASAQRIEHYEIAVYGSLASWAKQLGLNDDLQLLLASLDEEKRTDERLTELAKRVVNPDAAAVAA
jgi:ferritin-like metal-binding protein YciE